jgi:hypothetical protein
LKRGGLPQKRRGKPPCGSCPKIAAADLPPGTIPGPHLAVELSEANRLALNYHRDGAAVGWNGVVTDDLVRRHAATIAGAERDVEAARQAAQSGLILSLAGRTEKKERGRP